MNTNALKSIFEAAILAAGEPLSLERLGGLFEEEQRPSPQAMKAILEELAMERQEGVMQLKSLASGYVFQVKQDYAPWVARLWEEKPGRYSRSFLETLAIIAYRQPVTRGEIEDIRGVAVNTAVIRNLMERKWIRIVGHRDVPGKPAIFGTTKEFLDYFNLNSLSQLPSLQEIKDIDALAKDLQPDLYPPEESEYIPALSAAFEQDLEKEAEISLGHILEAADKAYAFANEKIEQGFDYPEKQTQDEVEESEEFA